MSGRRVIPVRVVRPNQEAADGHKSDRLARSGLVSTAVKQVDADAPAQSELHGRIGTPPGQAHPTEHEAEGPAGEIPQDREDSTSARHDEAESWRGRAMRLQAEMENYRRRQKRFAQHEIETDRKRLLLAFIGVIDDLERALAASGERDNGLRQGVELTYRSALQLLEKEGVRPIEAQGQTFDPNWHEAIAITDSHRRSMVPNTVVRVMEAGYRLGDDLLRPAKVIVAA